MVTSKSDYQSLHIQQVSIQDLKSATYNPRHWDNMAIKHLTESIERFGLVDPILVNGSKKRKNIVIGWHFRLKIAKDLGYKEVPVVYLDIPEEEKERELNLRLNRNTGDWDMDLLKWTKYSSLIWTRPVAFLFSLRFLNLVIWIKSHEE